MTSYSKRSLCTFCRHRDYEITRFNADGTYLQTCAAFPDGVPGRFMGGAAYHTEPVRGDNGIQFEEDPDNPVPDDLAEEAGLG